LIVHSWILRTSSEHRDHCVQLTANFRNRIRNGYGQRLKKIFLFINHLGLLAKSQVHRFAGRLFEGQQTRGDLNNNSIAKCSSRPIIRSIGVAYVLRTWTGYLEPSTPANMASADPAVTASPSSHVGIANVRRDATRQTRDSSGNSPGRNLSLTWRTLMEKPS